jgi:F-type H+-transporting ATPase subunit epsilon
MASETLSLQIVTPEGVQLSEDVLEFTAPSVQGEFGVLPGHRPLVAALRTGIVGLRRAGDGRGSELERVAVGPGFVEVVDDRVVLLTDRFIRKEKIDPVRARLELKEADEALDRFAGEPTSPEYAALVLRETWAATELELYGDPPPAMIRPFQELEGASGESYRQTAESNEEQGGGSA